MNKLMRLIPGFNVLDVLLAWLGFSAGFLLVVPSEFLPARLFTQDFQSACIISLIGSLAYFISRLCMRVWFEVDEVWHQRAHERRIEHLVKCLDHTERAILREFIIRRRSVVALPISEQSVMNLIRGGVLEAIEDEGANDSHYMVNCVISLAARPLLSFRALGLPVGKLSEAQLEQLKKMRPAFLQPEYQVNRTHSGKLFRIRAVGPNGSQSAA